jgi:hypothetical protein
MFTRSPNDSEYACFDHSDTYKSMLAVFATPVFPINEVRREELSSH